MSEYQVIEDTECQSWGCSYDYDLSQVWKTSGLPAHEDIYDQQTYIED